MLNNKVNTIVIKTPEGVIFSMYLAGPVTRFLAWIIDFSCIAVITMIIGVLVSIFGVISFDFSNAIAAISYFIISIGYSIAAEWYWRGQTVGKKLLRLHVIDVQGLKLQFSQIMIRNLMRFVDNMPLFYFIGGIACLVSKKSQRLGDLVANTAVIRNPKVVDPDMSRIFSGKYNSLRKYPNLVARLRQLVSPQEAGIGLSAILRRNELESKARIELFSAIASHFRSIVQFPDEVTYGISDEQYVHNIVDVLYNIKPKENNKSAYIRN